MNEGQFKRVQHDTRCRESDEFLQSAILPLAIREVPGKGISEELKVDSDLVRASRMQRRFDKCRRTHPFRDVVSCSRLPPEILRDSHALSMGRVPRNCRADVAVVPL